MMKIELSEVRRCQRSLLPKLEGVLVNYVSVMDTKTETLKGGSAIIVSNSHVDANVLFRVCECIT